MGPVKAAEGVWSPARRRLTAGLLLTISIAAFEALAVATVLPTVARELGGLDWYGWVFSGFMLASLVGITTGGEAADRRGPAVPLLAGSALFVAGLLFAGFAGSMPALVAGRVVQGFGSGALSSVAYVAVARGYGEEERPRMLALFSSAWVLPGLVGPALAALIAEAAGWRWVFLALAAPSAIGVGLAFDGLARLGAPDVRAVESTGRPRRTRVFHAAALALGVAAMLGALDGAASAVASVRSTATCAAMVATGLALAWPAASSLFPAGTFRAAGGSPAAVAAMALLSFAFFGAEAFLPLALSEAGGHGSGIVGVVLTVGALSWTVGAWVQARLAGRVPRAALAGAGLAFLFAGVSATAAVLFLLAGVPAVAFAWSACGFGIGVAYATVSLVVLDGAGEGAEGEASAALQLANVLGVAMGAGIGGAILSFATRAGLPPLDGIHASNALMVVAALLALAVSPRLRVDAAADPGRRQAEAVATAAEEARLSPRDSA